MKLIINGMNKELDGVATVADVVRALGLDGNPLVAELDGAVVARDRWGDAAVRDGAVLELVHFVGGG